MATSDFARRRHWPTVLHAVPTITVSTRGGYAPTALLVLIALVPALVNFTALDLLTPTIAQSLGTSTADASWVPLLGNAAIPLGFLVAVDVLGGVGARRLSITAVGLLVLSALCAGLAPNLEVLITAHTLQGFASGLLGAAVVLAMVAASTPRRLPLTIAVLGIGLFGATTLGPLIGGYVEYWSSWREFFVFEAMLAVLALLLAVAAIPEGTGNQLVPFGGAVLVLITGALVLLFIGIGMLYWYHYTRPQVLMPAVIGGTSLLALIAAEATRRAGLRMQSFGGLAIVSSVAAFAFGGLLALLLEFLLQIRGLGAQDAGALLWPAPLAALLGLAVAAWQLAIVTQYTGNATVLQISALLGLGVALAVAAPVLMGALNVTKQLLARTLALMVFMPYVQLAASGPVMTYLTTVRQTIHFSNLLWQQGFSDALSPIGETSTQAHAASTTATTTANTLLLQSRALVFGINDAAVVLFLALVVAAALGVVLFRMAERAAAISERATVLRERPS